MRDVSTVLVQYTYENTVFSSLKFVLYNRFLEIWGRNGDPSAHSNYSTLRCIRTIHSGVCCIRCIAGKFCNWQLLTKDECNQ